MKIRIGICGYGNLGRGAEAGIAQNPDMELVAVFTRRKPVESLKINSDVPVVHVSDVEYWKDKIDVMILCGGSANDLPEQTPTFAKIFNTVDSFDTHAKIPEYFKTVDAAAVAGGKISIISIGWDPGLFSVMRLYAGAVLPSGNTYTFWGPGVSQGHSDAIRRIDGVADAIQYTIPVDEAVERVKSGKKVEFETREKHKRVCYVAVDSICGDEDKARIEKEIKEMPNYFADYDTTVNFISQDELRTNHGKLMHGGQVIHAGKTRDNNNQVIEFSLKLDSNPEFTASVLLAYARAAYRLSATGEKGARTIFDIPPILLSGRDRDDVVRDLL
ncbi:MAG: diaminopimelate dehydrogenase [Oscillospiraceae bacterium]|nr:diaminopimelate dehydrogenase [Oscillospiraceae bacterium]